jgi:glycosyltransferase involved in cell wall biosynthesis
MSSKSPLVSIGLPVYNAEKYLNEAINSILLQTYTNFELIISDNASTDRTQEICLTYSKKDPRIKYFRNDRNLGASPNFNRTFMLSSGEYFKWAPYDDLIEPDFLSQCVQVLDNRPDVVLCYSRVKIIDENGAFDVEYDPGPATNSLDPQQRFANLILHPEYAVQQMGLIRSIILGQTGLHRSFPSSDEILLAELALLGKFYELPDRLYLYRRHRAQSSHGAQRSRLYFFDTSLRGKILLPTWAYFGAGLKVISKKSLKISMKFACYLAILRWLFIPAHFRAMGKDLLLAIAQFFRGATTST